MLTLTTHTATFNTTTYGSRVPALVPAFARTDIDAASYRRRYAAQLRREGGRLAPGQLRGEMFGPHTRPLIDGDHIAVDARGIETVATALRRAGWTVAIA
jgi:hypothetical protein